MTPQVELDPADYHLRLMIEQMQRDGRSEAAIECAVRIASGWTPPAQTTVAGGRRRRRIRP
jgi:hypothetical protein